MFGEKLAEAMVKPVNPASIVFLGLYTLVWGLWVANPLWSVFGRAPLYGVLAIVAPEVFWGLLAIVCGIITVHGAVKRKYRYLVRGAIISCWHWSMIAIFYFAGDPLNTGGITCLAFAFYAAFIYLNIRVNCKNDKDALQILH